MPDPTCDSTSGGNDTFLQQYQVITDFYQPGGPILFLQGPEDPLLCVEDFAVYQYGAALGALVVTVEHRYFGHSVPGNLSWAEVDLWPTAALASLTLHNVLMDSVELLRWIKSTVDGAHGSKIVTFGGSYGGFLATMERTHHPDVFFAAIASSAAPFQGLISDPDDPLAYVVGDWVCVRLENMHVHKLIRPPR